ncbi:hypothetical protein [Bdellovibrio svalbardensis]|uniref:Uncharacterized protein n=1 Tax=Bdellovibrio svalbardensis TaxID=2972972 RepID=A0ABT6DI79_9BACT|nr:hypothetical protein [Bdellovibrio svalbardensis]MDG0815629.1 hypothetical protein [Bdellovibrio svalbardensis]
MQFLKNLFLRLTTERVFYYNWEQRDFERRPFLCREQLFCANRSTGQITCRSGRD